MARIKRTDIYPYDITPSKPDFLVGSDFDDGSKTKSYSLDTIFGLFKDSGFIQDASKDGVPYVRQDGSWVPAPTSGAGGDVVSVFGRIGAVSAVEGDYAAFYADIDHTHSWGEMQGTLSDQTDLQNALNLKYDASNPSGYISSVDWGDIGGTLSSQTDLQNALNSKYDASNPSGYISSVDWGDIGGTLSSQTDLQNALDLKLESVDWGDIGGTLSSQTDLQNALDLKLESVDWGDIGGTLSSQTDLQNALDLKLESVDISDINALGTPTINTFLRGDGNWATYVTSLGTISDVSLSSPLSGDVLRFNGTNWVNDDLSDVEFIANKGQANGYAPLDSGVKIPISYIPDSLIGQVNYQGTWAASTNTPTLANPPSAATKGHYYVASDNGTQFGISFQTGDWIISNGAAWEKVDNTDAVTSVFGRLGAVVANAGDYTFAQIGSKPTTLSGYGITDAVPTSRTLTAGTGLTGGGSLAADRTLSLDTGYTDGRYVTLATSQSITGVKTFNTSTNFNSQINAGSSLGDTLLSLGNTLYTLKARIGNISTAGAGQKQIIRFQSRNTADTQSRYFDIGVLPDLGVWAISGARDAGPGLLTDVNPVIALQGDVNGNLTTVGNLAFNNVANHGITTGSNSQRLLIGGGATWSFTSGAYLSLEGLDYGGVGLGGNAVFSLPSGKNLLVGSSIVWNQGNDGAGSGLDADLLDGVQGSGYVQTSRTLTAGTGLTGGGSLAADRTLSLDTGYTDGRYVNVTGDTMTGNLTIDRSFPIFILQDTGTTGTLFRMVTPTQEWRLSNTYQTGTGDFTIRDQTNTRNVLTLSATDGSTNLSRDLTVNGEASFESGRVQILNSAQRLRILGTGTGDSNQVFIGLYESNGTTRQGYVGFVGTNNRLYLRNDYAISHIFLTDGINGLVFTPSTGGDKIVWHSGNLTPSDYVPTSRTITAGDGLTGGGNLTANRSFAVDSTVVRTSGTQSIGGAKTFTSNVIGSGTFTATNFILSSDRRLKKDINDYTPVHIPIRWREFTWKESGERQIGTIAQETPKQFVTKGADGKLAVKTVEMLMAKVAELEARIINLER